MKASCIGAAGMTSGFGPSYQECLLALPKVNFFPPNIVSCIKIQNWHLHHELRISSDQGLKRFPCYFNQSREGK